MADIAQDNSTGGKASRGTNSRLKKVSMNLTERDLVNADILLDVLNERSQASVVSRCMDIVRTLSEMKNQCENSRFILEKTDGEKVELMIPSL